MPWCVASKEGTPKMSGVEQHLSRPGGVAHSQTVGSGSTESSAEGVCAVLVISPDRFTRVNGLIGFRLGDEVLELIRGRIASTLHMSETVVHLPGDTFAVYLDRRLLDNLLPLIGRVQDLLQRTYVVQGQVIQLTVGMGIALGGEHEEAEVMLRNAMLALRVSKAKGLGVKTTFSQAMRDEEQMDQKLGLDLQRAMVLGEFEVHFQSQVDMASARRVGSEALVRWRHPRLGQIPPSRFLPLAEESGLLMPLGEWVLKASMRAAMVSDEQGTIAVNVAPSQLVLTDFATTVKGMLSASGLPPERLVLEVTEGVLLHNEAHILTSLHALQAMGVAIAIDDFGTGCFPLRKLADIPCNIIKIHPSLLWTNERQRVIVRAITTMAGDLGLTTVAEGIEVQQQAQQAKEDGCTTGQGFFYGPVSSRLWSQRA